MPKRNAKNSPAKQLINDPMELRRRTFGNDLRIQVIQDRYDGRWRVYDDDHDAYMRDEDGNHAAFDTKQEATLAAFPPPGEGEPWPGATEWQG